jgi:hypothetical protein
VIAARTVAIALIALVVSTAHAAAQSRRAPGALARKATTVDALVAYPVFFHTQAVRVRGALLERERGHVLRHGDAEVRVAGPAVAGAASAPDTVVEVTGTFLDVGRLTEGDPRLTAVDLTLVWEPRGRPWPAAGEVLLLAIDSLAGAEPFPAPSIRALALDPWRYVNQRVTVTGRFRGMNLYGDLPDAPARERYAFALQSADAAVWVVGLRPRGRGFNLNVYARVDTGRSLEVSGTVTFVRGLPIIEGSLVAEGREPADQAPSEPAARVPAIGPRPEVIFSAPTRDETDVPVTTNVRIQFSRDLDPRSFAGQVRVGYVRAEAAERGASSAPRLEFSMRYDEGLRMLEILFPEPLERFGTLLVELADGIKARDGATLLPWTLTFSLGG